MGSRPVAAFGLLVAVLGSLVGLGGPATAAGAGAIDHVQSDEGSLRILYSIPGLGEGVVPDLDSLQVTVDGKSAEASAVLAANSNTGVRRTAILAIDVSNSMKGERFAQAKLAAKAFLDAAPLDVFVGIVTFAGSVDVVQEPTLDRAVSAQAVDQLTLSLATRLYDGIRLAVRSAGTDGQRSVLVLSDGKDTSTTPLPDIVNEIKDTQVKVDVVALEQAAGSLAPLQAIAAASEGSVLTADDPKALSQVFSSEANALAKQLLITAELPASQSGTEGSLVVSVDVAGETFNDSAFVTVKSETKAVDSAGGTLQAVSKPLIDISPALMIGGLVAAGVGALFVLFMAVGSAGQPKVETVQDRIAAYSRTGDPRSAAPSPGAARVAPSAQGVTGQAVDVAARALANSRGFEAALAARLDGAAVSLKPAEWLLLHAAISVGAGLVGLLLSSGGLLFAILGVVVGAFLPWVYLGMKRSRRLKSFDSQLADTLQLISGGLSAGLSLAQSVDTVVREGTEPVAGELRRALMEARLGVSLEDAMDSVAERMESDDFHWVVMAIRIQREVGGNLAELLLNVAATLREREFLRRQVKSLSAEGRLSAWIVGGLPPGFVGYLTLVNPGYLEPMFTTTLGWLMIGLACVMMVVGVFWLSKMVKVEV